MAADHYEYWLLDSTDDSPLAPLHTTVNEKNALATVAAKQEYARAAVLTELGREFNENAVLGQATDLYEHSVLPLHGLQRLEKLMDEYVGGSRR